MACHILYEGDRPVGFCCTRGRLCACGRRATLLCDGRVRRGLCGNVPCDVPLCERCATHVGPDRDLCPSCAKEVTP